MIPLLPWRESAELVGMAVLAFAAEVSALEWGSWRSPRFRWIATAVMLPPVLGLVLWRVGSPELAQLGVDMAWCSVPLVALVDVALLLIALVSGVAGRLSKRRHAGPELAQNPARRALLERAALVVPIGAVGLSVARSQAGAATRVVDVPMHFRDLPAELQGLRILHLSDLHLGIDRTASDVASMLAHLQPPPDLIVLTGDIADPIDELERVLGMVTAAAPRLGVFAVLGNHEYLSGIEPQLVAYQKSRVRLLINEAVTVQVGDAKLWIAGVDDPVYRGPSATFYDAAIAECAKDAPPDAFRLLLCHRPWGFEPAARHGFQLTLSGHTHGGQIGLSGRSVFEGLGGLRYLWGQYRRGESQLYTTSGFGHWFPMRINCPAEAPMIRLERV